jgi:hypothetical protein
MPDAPTPEQIDVLRAVSRGEQDLDALAAALGSLPPMVLPMPPADAAAFLQGLPGDPNLATGSVKFADLPRPEPRGVRGATGALVPWVFTSHDAAGAWLRQQQLVTGDETWLSMTRPWPAGVQDFLARGYDGAILDEGTDRRITLDRAALARLHALLTLPAFIDLPTLRVVALDGHLHRQPGPDGQGWLTFVFDSAEAAALGASRMAPPGTATMSTPEIGTLELLRKMQAAGVDRLVVNPATATERTYGARDMALMLDRLAGRVEVPVDVAAAAAVPALLARARAGSAPPAVPAIGRAEDAAHAFWLALHGELKADPAARWSLVERVAFEMDLHLEVDPEPADGLRWPAFYHMKAGRPTTAFAFTGAARARDYVTRAAKGREVLALAGIEAIRWLVSAPGKIHTLVIDATEEVGGHDLAVASLAGALLPVGYAIPDLRQVPAVGLDRVGRLPGARGLKPEAVRALVLGWRNLVGFKERRTVEHAGRSWIPIASSLDAFFAALPREAGRVAPDPAGKEPPFARWLAQAAGCAGLLLDSAGPAPIALEPTDLVALDRWAAHPDRQPTTAEIVAEVARLLQAGTLTPVQAGRVAADLPEGWIAVHERPPQVELMMFPDTDALLVFTSEAAARTYLGRLAQRYPDTADFQPASVRCGWTFHPLVTALQSYTEAWIDPTDPRAGGGLRLSGEALRAGVARLDETLRPRVPGFIAEA